MKFTKTTPRKPIMIAGETFQLPQPFAAGHVCSGTDAQALNQLLAENTRNNNAKAVTDAKAKAGYAPAAMQSELDKYVEAYEFSGGSRSSSDPIEKIAISIAETKVKDALKKQGTKINAVSAENMNKLVTDLLDKYPQIREAAKKSYEAQRAAANTAIEVKLPSAA